MSSLFLHCRKGFERECADEIAQRARAVGIEEHCSADVGAGYAEFRSRSENAETLHRRLQFADLVFARQWFVASLLCEKLPGDDRVSRLAEALKRLPVPVAEVFVEAVDTDRGRMLLPLCRGIAPHLRRAMERAGMLRSKDAGQWRAHVCFLASDMAQVGYADPCNSAPWPMGIPRLKLAGDAPSRAALKLEEAFLRLLTDRERERLLRPGMRAVDLGAAPGGWTWVLVRRQMRVTAVDNGALAPSLLREGLVEHRREDGFRFRPLRPVDWMVCDIVEKPARSAALVAQWMRQGWCRHAMVNLKLPMKRRREAVERCLAHIRRALAQTGLAGSLRAKQLYHDRDEVTVYVSGSTPHRR